MSLPEGGAEVCVDENVEPLPELIEALFVFI